MRKKRFCLDCGKQITRWNSVRCRSCSHKGILNSNYRNGLHSDNPKRCIDCNKIIEHVSIRCGKYSRQGKLNSNYIDGRSFKPYNENFTPKLKLQIRKRDNYTCQNCSITEEEHNTVHKRVLIVHHIDYSKDNCENNNLITLCNQCNTRANFNRTYWKEFYQNKINNLNSIIIKND